MTGGRPRNFRFAPSPNGLLHLGHALSALTNSAMARASGGRFLLRIEDIDGERSRGDFTAAIFEDLRWLGLSWETPVRHQSEHIETYRDLLARLRADGLLYPAFMCRGEVRAHVDRFEAEGQSWPRDPDGALLYPGLDKHLATAERNRRMAAGMPFTWRLDVAAALSRLKAPLAWHEWTDMGMVAERTVPADPAAWGDVVLARRGFPTSYHLSVVADDAIQGITDVVRGLDLFGATSIHRLLQELLGLPEPTYFHHRLMLGADGRKLAKSEGAMALRALRAEGCTPGDIRELTGTG